MSKRHCRTRFRAVHPGNTGEFCFKMRNRALVGIVPIEIAEGALEQIKNLRFVMFYLGTDFKQLDKIRCGLAAPMIGSNPCECTEQRNLPPDMQIRFAAFRES